jgi:hypothetical protein
MKSFMGAAMALSCLAGCYSGPGVESPYPADPWPQGIYVPKAETKRPINMSGIFPASAGDPFCCWLSSEAHFEVLPPRSARVLRFTVFVPDIKALHGQSQKVTVALNAHAAATFADLGPGEHMLTVPLPAHASRPSAVDLTMGYTFTPKRLNVNGDTRVLSVELRRVSAR